MDRVRVSFHWGHFDLLYSQNYFKIILLHTRPQKLYRALRLCTPSYRVIVNPTPPPHHTTPPPIHTPIPTPPTQPAPIHPLVATNTQKGDLSTAPCQRKFFYFCLWRVFQIFLNVLKYQLEIWFIYSVDYKTYWAQVSPEWGPCGLVHILGLNTVN